METEAASTAVRTQTRAPCVVATRSTPSTQTVARASVSRHLCRTAPLHTPPTLPASAGPAPCHVRDPWKGSFRETRKGKPGAMVGMAGAPGEAFWGGFSGACSPPGPGSSASCSLAMPDAGSLAAEVLHVLILEVRGGPRQGVSGRRKVYTPLRASAPEAQAFPPLIRKTARFR
ncbi:hypothetical protein P7K49_002343 [Saguinus oedipus]|uniref:Uncharacterized protein n=1 Tax=Saguinus oedipus TaxID=9490 RepID=A0ABQ9WH24_SAGOE|nr:hypothetical protein P7K49_002343 [Saguinus oedipus]